MLYIYKVGRLSPPFLKSGGALARSAPPIATPMPNGLENETFKTSQWHWGIQSHIGFYQSRTKTYLNQNLDIFYIINA